MDTSRTDQFRETTEQDQVSLTLLRFSILIYTISSRYKSKIGSTSTKRKVNSLDYNLLFVDEKE